MRKLQQEFADRQDLLFLIVVQREPHAGRMGFRSIAQPTNLAERIELAQRMNDELQLNMQVVVDGMDDASREYYSQLPGPAFVIAPGGQIVAKFPWAEASLIQSLLCQERTGMKQ